MRGHLPLDSLAINPESGKAYMHVDECWYCGPCAARLGPRRAEPAVTQALTSRLADRDADVRAYARLALAGDSAPGDGAGGAGVIPSTTSCRSSAAPG